MHGYNPLGYLFSRIIEELNLSEPALKNIVRNKTSQMVKTSVIQKKSLFIKRTYLMSELYSKKLTWKKFCANMDVIDENTFKLELLIGWPIKKTLHEVKCIEFTDNIKALAILFNLFVVDMNLDQRKYTRCLLQYVDKYHQTDPHYKKVGIIRNMNTRLKLQIYTWKIFCRGLKILGVTNFTLTFSLEKEFKLANGNSFCKHIVIPLEVRL